MKKIFSVAMFTCLSYLGFSQTAASYSFTSSSSVYSSIAATGTLATGVHGDDMAQTSIPIGFSFSFCGSAYTVLSACSNGWLSLANASSPIFTPSASSMGTIAPLLMPYYGDLNIASTGSVPAAAYYQTTGTAPNRVFTFEWSRYATFVSAAANLNFQVKLYESTNSISFCYDSSIAGMGGLPYAIGIGNSATDFQTVDSAGSSSSSVFYSTASFPVIGTVYAWNAPASCTGTPTAGTASIGISHMCATTNYTLSLAGYTTGTGIGYQWQSSIDGVTWTNISGATAPTYTGVFTGCNATQFRCSVSCSASSTTVFSSTCNYTPNSISGYITYGTYAAPLFSSMKVWLIKYNPIDSSIAAVDSMTACDYMVNQYYEFDNVAAGTYRVKARILADTPGISGYIPTYSLSTAYWYMADTAAHTTNCDSLHIDMMYGTVPAGPGFIGGYVYSGAGRRTTSDVPEPGMLMYLRNSAGTILTHAYTDATGAYSFSGIANGSYTIYPEYLGYATTPSATVVLDAAHETINAVDFKKHTTAKTISPYTVPTVVSNVASSAAISIYPNPASQVLNIDWTGMPTATADVLIADIAGRTIYTSTIAIGSTSGATKVDIAQFANGLYVVTIKGAGFSITNKLVIAK